MVRKVLFIFFLLFSLISISILISLILSFHAGIYSIGSVALFICCIGILMITGYESIYQFGTARRRIRVEKSVKETTQSGIEGFWLRTWIAGEIGLAPYSYGENIGFNSFTERIYNQLSKYSIYQEFFARFSPLDNEYCIKESCPDNSTLGTARPLPNGFTFLSTNRRIFYGATPNIECIDLSHIEKCELISEGKISTGIIITNDDNTVIQLSFKMPIRFAEAFLNNILTRSRVAKENGDVPALNAAIKEHAEKGKLKGQQISCEAILAGIVAGLFGFFTLLPKIHDLGAVLIAGAGGCSFGFFIARLPYWSRRSIPRQKHLRE